LINDENGVKAKRKELETYSRKWDEVIEMNWGPVEDIHLFIIESLGNEKLVDTYLGLLDHIKRMRKHFGGRFTRQRFDKMLTEHLEILDAIIEGNGDRAELAVQNHLHSAAAYLLGLTS